MLWHPMVYKWIQMAMSRYHGWPTVASNSLQIVGRAVELDKQVSPLVTLMVLLIHLIWHLAVQQSPVNTCYFVELIKMRYIFRDHLRWVPTAAEICFTNPFTSFIFGEGNCVPVVRGAGVYQQGLDLCINRLNDNRWVHFFPEGEKLLSHLYRTPLSNWICINGVTMATN